MFSVSSEKKLWTSGRVDGSSRKFSKIETLFFGCGRVDGWTGALENFQNLKHLFFAVDGWTGRRVLS